MKEAIKQNLRSGFQAIGDLRKDATLKHLTGSSYNEATGKTSFTYSETDVEVILTNRLSNDVSENTIKSGNRNILLLAEQVSFVPVPGDDSLVIDGETYEIKGIKSKFGELYILAI